jgi:autotransporter adhesin
LFYTIQALTAAASAPIAADNVNNYSAPSVVAGKNGLAIGYGAASSGLNSVAIGNASSDGGRANVVSVGTAGATRQVINVGAGILATDAVNVSQLQPLVTALGGGATFNTTTGAVTGPTYNVGGANYTDVGSAIAATNRLSVQYTPDSSGNPTNHITLSGANNGQPVSISNVAAGITNTDAVNVGQLKAATNGFNQLSNGLSNLSGQVAQNQIEARRGIATSAAMANLPFGNTPGKWSPAVAYGGFKGESAVAMGLQYSTDSELRVKLRATASFVPSSNDVTFGGGAGWEF